MNQKMKAYFQFQKNNRLRIYNIILLSDSGDKRKQKTIATLSAEEPIPLAVMELLSDDDKMRLSDKMNLLRSQAEYDRTRDGLIELPALLDDASRLLAADKLTLSDDQKNELREKMSALIKHLKLNDKTDKSCEQQLRIL